MRTAGGQLFSVAFALAALAGCAGGDRFADIREFMAEVESRPRERIAPLPEFEAYRPFAYGAADRRSPFEPSVVAQPKTARRNRDAGVRPPENHVKQHLERFPLSALAMVGSLRKGDLVHALVQDTRGGVHRVQPGDYMGDRWGRVESIDDTSIHITEIVSDGAGGWLRSPRTLELSGFK